MISSLQISYYHFFCCLPPSIRLCRTPDFLFSWLSFFFNLSLILLRVLFLAYFSFVSFLFQNIFCCFLCLSVTHMPKKYNIIFQFLLIFFFLRPFSLCIHSIFFCFLSIFLLFQKLFDFVSIMFYNKFVTYVKHISFTISI